MTAQEKASSARARGAGARRLYAVFGGALLALASGPWLYKHEGTGQEQATDLFRLFTLITSDRPVGVSEDHSPMTGVAPVAVVVLCATCLIVCALTEESMQYHLGLAIIAGIAIVVFAIFVGTSGRQETPGPSAWLSLLVAMSVGGVATARTLLLKHDGVAHTGRARTSGR